MQTADAPTPTSKEYGDRDGVVALRRSAPRLIVDIVRDPLTAIPAASFDAKMVVTRNLGRLRFYISDPALIHETLVRNADRLAKSEETKRVLGAALGDGLLTADGAMWRWQRQALAPAFQHDRLTQLLPSMIAAAETTRDRWLDLPPGSTIEVGPEMTRTTFAIIVETMMSGPQSIDAARVERSVTDFLGATSWMFAMAILKAPRWVPFPGRARAATASRFMRATVRARVAARRSAGGAHDDLIGRLLAAADPETGRTMTDEEITDNILTFIMAGHETTAVALAWTLVLLAEHPACAARLAAELDEVTGEGPVLPYHVAKLTYAKQVIDEGMRLYPPAPIIARKVTRKVEIAGVTLPVGSIVFVPIFALHRNRHLWTRPDTFDPDRFAPDAVKDRHRFAFLPFGAGPRVCIGNAFATMEAIAILAVLAKTVRWERVADMPEPIMRVTLRPRRPLRLRVAPRSGPPEPGMRSNA